MYYIQGFIGSGIATYDEECDCCGPPVDERLLGSW